jgi:hypothetical protein
VQVLRVHDPARRPASWTEAIGPQQFVAFAKDVASGAPCDTGGQPFADPAMATCVLFDSLAEARAFCDTAVLSAPLVRLDVFDAQGRANSPLLTFVHPSRLLDTSPRVLRRRQLFAWGLIAGGIPLLIYAYWKHTEREIILPAFLGINMLIVAVRLLWFNLGIRETERARQERLKRIER